MEELKLIKTDRNGTKYYHDYNCPRCGGAGVADKWNYTGRTCWQCGGSGRLTNPKLVKIYTPEYDAKLTAKRIARHEAKDAERRAAGYESVMGRHGFNEDGIAYVYTGNTYAIKDTLKANGARWNWGLYAWVSKHPISDFPCIELKAEEVFQYFDHHGWDISNSKCENWARVHGLK